MSYSPECGFSWWMFHVSLKKNVYCFWIKWSVNVHYIQLIVMLLLSLFIFLLIFGFLDLSISERGVVKSQILIVDSSFFPWNSIRFWLMDHEALLLGTLRKCILGELIPLSFCNVLSSLWWLSLFWHLFCLKLIWLLLLS